MVETPTGMYVVSTVRTVEGWGSVWVDAEFEYTRVAVAIAAAVRTLPYRTRFMPILPSVWLNAGRLFVDHGRTVAIRI